MALLVHKMGRFMKKKGYRARKRRDTIKGKTLCYNCNSPDHIVVDCPYEDKRCHNGDLKLKKNKKDKKEKKKKKAKKSFTFNKKKRVVVIWSLGIVTTLIVMMMQALVMIKGPLGEPLQASPSPTSHLSSTLHRHAL
jgi:hypothetical protein